MKRAFNVFCYVAFFALMGLGFSVYRTLNTCICDGVSSRFCFVCGHNSSKCPRFVDPKCGCPRKSSGGFRTVRMDDAAFVAYTNFVARGIK